MRDAPANGANFYEKITVSTIVLSGQKEGTNVAAETGLAMRARSRKTVRRLAACIELAALLGSHIRECR